MIKTISSYKGPTLYVYLHVREQLESPQAFRSLLGLLCTPRQTKLSSIHLPLWTSVVYKTRQDKTNKGTGVGIHGYGTRKKLSFNFDGTLKYTAQRFIDQGMLR
jgi:hypothetical protein